MIRRRSVLTAAALSTVFAAYAQAQVTRSWDFTAAEGYFDIASNWSGDVVPGPLDTAKFDRVATQSVLFDNVTGDRTNAALSVVAGNVTFRRASGLLRTYTVGSATIDTGRYQVTDLTFVSNGDISLVNGGRMDLNAGAILTAASGSVITLGGSGSAAENNLFINNGATATGDLAYLGTLVGKSGHVTLAGTTAAMTLTDDFYVGRNGAGALDITAGAKVSNNNGWLGWNLGSVGTATVSGSGSIWTNTRNLSLGDSSVSGIGTLTISSGARLNVGDTASLGSFGIVINDVNTQGGVGGELFIYNGSTLTNTSALPVLVGNTNQYGKVQVSGANSIWTNDHRLFLASGTNAKGIIDIKAGGQVTFDMVANMGVTGGLATLAVNGANSIFWTKNNLNLGDVLGGRANVTLTNAGDLRVGDRTDNFTNYDVFVSDTDPIGTAGGVMSILNGSQLTSSQAAVIGFNGGSGRVIISGVNSKWNASGQLTVGSAGTGDLQILSQATAGTTFLVVGDSQNGAGTVTVSGGGVITTSADVQLGNTHPSAVGTVTVSGANSAINTAASLGVGTSGTGTLNLNSAGKASAVNGVVGFGATAVGTINLTDAGSLLDVEGDLTVGTAGQGTLNLNTAAAIQVGDATFTSVGAGLFVSDLNVGGASGGNLRIGANSTVNHLGGDVVILGYSTGEYGRVVVSGTNAALNAAGSVIVGRSGQGVLDINNGGRATLDSSLFTSLLAGGSATISVAGANSLLREKNDIFLTAGTLTSSASGRVIVGDVLPGTIPAGTFLIADANAPGTSGGNLNVNANGVLTHTGDLSVGNTGFGGAYGKLAVTGAGSIVSITGQTYVGTGGALIVNSGAIVTLNNPSVSSGAIDVINLGSISLAGGELRANRISRLSGDGFSFTGGKLSTRKFVGALVQSGGTLAPLGTGTRGNLTVDSYTMNAASTLEIELGSSVDDSVGSTGTISIDGTLTLLNGGYLPSLGDHFSILNGSSISGHFAKINGVLYSPTLSLAVTYELQDVFYNAAIPGDATLDGRVNFDDLVPLAQNYNLSNKTWVQGDFNGSGNVNFDDLVPLAQHYNQVGLAGLTEFSASFQADWALAQSLVPEPTTLGAVSLGLVLLRRRVRLLNAS